MARVVFSADSPGDPRLATARIRELVASADAVVADRSVHPDLLGRAPARARIELVPDGDPSGDATRDLVALASEHSLIVRLVAAAPQRLASLFDEARRVADEGIAIEIVPWVGLELLLATHAGVVVPAAGAAPMTIELREGAGAEAPGWVRAVGSGAPAIVTTTSAALARLADLLAAEGVAPDREVLVARSLGGTDQSITVTTVGEVGSLATAHAGAVVVALGHGLAIDGRLDWRRGQRLRGARVLVTRTREQASTTVDSLRDEGADVLVVPLIEIHPPRDRAPLTRAVADVARFDWIVFTSANGVDAFFDELRVAGRDSRALARARVGVVGPATGRALARHGVRADLVAREHVGEGLAADLLATFGTERPRVLLPRAAKARDVIPDALRDAGCAVEVVTAYETHAPPVDVTDALAAMLKARAVDAVTFTSSSTVHHLADALGADAARTLEGVVLASIGPVTTEAARARGLHVSVTAPHATAEALVDALAAHWAHRPS